MAILEVDFDSFTIDDINRLITEKISEDNQLEYKETLPSKNNNKTDPWMNGEDKIGDKARNEILEEIIAFANAQGGMLFLGISETTDGKGIPSCVNPIPNCHELVKRFELQIRDCIEPKLHNVQIKAIETNTDTDTDRNGILIFDVQKSIAAPHRLIPTKECYIRRNDRSEKMSMIEIQDHTLLIEKGIAKVEGEFKKQRDGFNNHFLTFAKKHEIVLGIRAVIVPVYAEFSINKLFNNYEFKFPLEENIRLDLGNHNPVNFEYTFMGRQRPILRGVSFRGEWPKGMYLGELFCNGTAQISTFLFPENIESNYLPLEDFIGMVINVVLLVQKYKTKSGFPDIEYGLEIEILNTHWPFRVSGFNNSHNQLAEFSSGSILFPRYSVQHSLEYDSLITLVYNDFFNAGGEDKSYSLSFNWNKYA